MSIEEQFNAAVKVIRSLPKNGSFQPSDELKLKFYAYFKQGTEGANTTKKPPFYDIVNRYKWDAWKKLGEMPRTEAMSLYVEELKKVIETLGLNEEVSGFLDILGPFYEFLPMDDAVNNNNGDSNRSSKDSSPTKTTPNGRNQFSTYDSDGDEFADTLDTSSPAHNDQIPVILQNGTISKQYLANSISGPNGASVGMNGGTKPESSAIANSHKATGASNGQATSGQALGNGRAAVTFANSSSINGHSLGFNEQLTMAVFKLQHSLDRVVNRIDALETLLSHQSKCLERDRFARSSALSKWLFPELSGKTTAFVIAWPLIVYFVINYVKQIRKK